MYYADQLVPTSELFSALQQGTLDCVQSDDDSMGSPADVAPFSAYFPLATRYSLDVPALFNEFGLGKIWTESYNEVKNVTWLSSGSWDPCNFITKDPIRSLADIKGKKLYTFPTAGRFLSRLQPNDPSDDLRAVAASILDGLMYGCGDAVIGINPATDSVPAMTEILKLIDELVYRYEIPTQSCVLSHVTNAVAAMELGAPVDLVFQSIAGTEIANKNFGINLALLGEARDAALSLHRGTVGDNVMYFETGQGTALSAEGNWDVDMQTCEARAYTVARKFEPLLVNTVVGFIGPEYLYDGKQIIRAGLEDHFCAKLLGLPMGCDICYTNHAEADQNDMDNLLTLLAAAGLNYIMGIPGCDDIMLGYQTTSFHDVLYARQLFGLRPAPEFEAWLEKMEIFGSNKLLPAGRNNKFLTSYELSID